MIPIVSASFDIADFPATVLTLDGLFEVIDVLDEDQVAAVLDDAVLAQLAEHAVEALARRH